MLRLLTYLASATFVHFNQPTKQILLTPINSKRKKRKKEKKEKKPAEFCQVNLECEFIRSILIRADVP